MSIIKNGKNIIGVYKGSTPISKIYKGDLSVYELNVVYNVTAVFNVTSTTEPTKIVNSSAISGFTRMCVDGVKVPVTDTYTFDTLGEHTVQYKLTDETKFANAAFSNCTNLTSVTIPESVVSVGNSCFDGCRSLTEITIPESVTKIGANVFRDCFSLTSVTIPNSVTSIGGAVFIGCTSLSSVIIGDSVTVIDNSFFYKCTSLTSVTMGDNVTRIGDSSFYKCTSLTEITIPSSVTSISNYAFSGCTSLSSITCLATTAPTLGTDVFYALPSSGTLIYPCESDYNTWLEQLGWENTCNQDIPEEELPQYDVTATFNLTSTTEPTVICGSEQISAITAMAIDGVQIDVTSAYTFNTTGEHTVQYMLEDNTTISYYAFKDCVRMTRIELPDTLTSVASAAFQNCTSLTEVVIPESLISIGSYAFSGCTSLTEVVIPNGVKRIYHYAFQGCSSLQKITIGSGVQEIADNTMSVLEEPVFSGCTRLTEIISLAPTAPKIGSKAFNGIENNNGTLSVPQGADYSTWTTVLTSWTIQYI